MRPPCLLYLSTSQIIASFPNFDPSVFLVRTTHRDTFAKIRRVYYSTMKYEYSYKNATKWLWITVLVGTSDPPSQYKGGRFVVDEFSHIRHLGFPHIVYSTRQMSKMSCFWADWNSYVRLGVPHYFQYKEVAFLFFPQNLSRILNCQFLNICCVL